MLLIHWRLCLQGKLDPMFLAQKELSEENAGALPEALTAENWLTD